MCLAAVVFEEDARRAMQLRNDHPLGAVDDERAGGSHQRDLAHVDLLLLDLLDRIGHLAIEYHQPHLGPQSRCEGESALLAFGNVEGRLGQRIADELQARVAAVTDDRKDRGESGLQPLVPALSWRHAGLQEGGEGFQLRRQQEGHLEHAGTLRETLADTLLLGIGVGHGRSELTGQIL
ncbi:MAG: hypothetical protein AW07_02295 [Candidatus Accumulibacter sp. SK-11]|nr:MAG: hypothetical protein AW07_02295 [Candidatus Accumulibacter sp. SK-11]